MAAASPHRIAPLPDPDGRPRTAIIDIGSNSVRLVVYEGRTRTPATLFNEKLMAGLGRGVAANGRLADDAMALAETALRRFARLVDAMQVGTVRAVATAAVRDAANGPDFVERVRASTGLAIEVIDGETEARGAALGVIAGIPDADGVVGDLGGGSLELTCVSGGEPHERVSLPVGSLKLDAVRKRGRRQLGRFVEKALTGLDWPQAGRGRPFYMVGGSWRALAQVHMHLTDYPLPVVHHHVMPPDAPARLVRTMAQISLKSLREVPNLSTSRVPQLPGAAMLLREVTRRLGSSCIIASAYGLREGLLFATLPPDLQAEDPLIAAARAEAQRVSRFPEHGDLLLAWTDRLFPDEAPAMRRLRHAACLLSDVAWRAHPDFRAELGLEVGLHGNWVGITAPERAVLANALFACFGGTVPGFPMIDKLFRLADPVSLQRARLWGLALRLGQRIGGGTEAGLTRSRLAAEPPALVLALNRADAALIGEAVQRRLRALAQAMALNPQVRVEG